MHLAAALVVALATAQTPPPWGTGQSRPEDLDVLLVTFGPGDTVPEWWGHTSLVVQDRALNQSRLYNFGMFGFSTGFFHKFVQGRLEFWVAEDSTLGTFQLYKRLNRDVRIQELDLLPVQAAQISKALADHVLPANRDYLYHHYDDNCSTRPRDILDAAIGGQLKAATGVSSRMSIRAHTRRYSQVNLPMLLVLDFLQNDSLDKASTQQQEAFLPDELERQVDALQVTRPDGTTVPLVRKKTQWFTATRAPTPDVGPSYTGVLFLLGLGLGGVALGLGHLGRTGKRWPRVLLGLHLSGLGLTLGLLGFALFFIGFFTDHEVAHRNENLLFGNLLTLSALPLGLMLAFGSEFGRRWLRRAFGALAAMSVLGVVLKVLPWFDQNNWNVIALFLPLNLGVAATLWLDGRARPAAAKTTKPPNP